MSANQQVAVLDTVVRTLQATQMQTIIEQALPPGVSKDKFTRATLTAIQQNPDILDCDRNSLYNAIARCAQDGLMPDGRQAAIVAFSTRAKVRDPSTGKWGELWIKKAQHMPMVEGIIHLMAKADVFAYAASVYENDEFEQWNDEDGQHIKHRPAKMGQKRGARIGAFALGRTKAGAIYVEAMDMEDLEVPKRATKQKDSQGNLIGPWRDVPDRMEQKSCLHRLAKRVPSLALRDDDEFNDEPTPLEAQATRMEPAQPAATPPAGKDGPRRSAALQAVVDAIGADPAGAAKPSDEQPKAAQEATGTTAEAGKATVVNQDKPAPAAAEKPAAQKGSEVF